MIGYSFLDSFYILSAQVDAASSTLLMNKALKKMTTDGRLVAGAQAGKSGAGCIKVSKKEKTRIKQVEKAGSMMALVTMAA